MASAAAAATADIPSKDVAANLEPLGDEQSAGVDDQDDTDSILEQQVTSWCTPWRLMVSALVVISATVAVAGLLVQVTLEEGDQPEASASWEAARKAFPWLHFFSAFLPVSLTLRWLCWRLYKVNKLVLKDRDLHHKHVSS